MIGLTTAEVCAHLRIGRKTLRNLRRRGKLHGTRLGHRTVRYAAGEVLRLLGEPSERLGVYLELLARQRTTAPLSGVTPRGPQ